tara:strand:+ start:437 stop:913 length:477 start_codon:yes stop_codon:yes gene_type:complete
MNRDNSNNGNMHVLKKPIKYEISKDIPEDQYNPFGWDEMILLAHDDMDTHYIGVTREEGVVDRVEYLSCLSEEWCDATLGIFYKCKGLIDLDAVGSGYLYANRWDIPVDEELDEEQMEYDHLAEVVGSLSISQFKGQDKQKQYRAVINEIFQQYQKKD